MARASDVPDIREPEPDHTVTGALHDAPAWPDFLEFLVPADFVVVAEIGS